MLMASLPSHKLNLFEDKQVPLSRIQLNKRLALLDERDAADLGRIETLLHWSQIKTTIDDQFVDETRKSIASINHPFIKKIVIWRLELRIILSALRMRHQGQKKPPNINVTDFNYWYFIITKYWNEADFGLIKQLPWILEANELLLANKSLQLEKLLFAVVWEQYQRDSFGHYFDFEAVIIYVLRWDILSRWTCNNSKMAVNRFNHLVDIELKHLNL